MRKINNKKGFTIFEIVIALAILGLLYFALSDALFGKKGSIDMENSIETSVKQISEAVNKVGLQNQNSDKPRFMNTGAISIWTKMGKKVMANDKNNDLISDSNGTDTSEYIKSIGLNGKCHYHIIPDSDYPNTTPVTITTNGTPGQGLLIFQDCTEAAKAFSWDEKQMKNSEEVFAKYLQGVASGEILIEYGATGIAKNTSAKGLGSVTIGSGSDLNRDAMVAARFFIN